MKLTLSQKYERLQRKNVKLIVALDGALSILSDTRYSTWRIAVDFSGAKLNVSCLDEFLIEAERLITKSCREKNRVECFVGDRCD